MNRITKKIGTYSIVLFQFVPIAFILGSVYNFQKSTGSPGWIYDTHSSCKLYSHNFSNNRDFEWNGACEEGFAHGVGELKVFWNNKEYFHYKGSVVKGKLSGFGSLRMYDDGDVYAGEFRNGLLNGQGSFYNDDGDHYIGNYEQGMKNGKGEYWYKPSSHIFKYVGDWKEDKENGYGTLHYRNGKEVKGIFRNGKLVERTEIIPNDKTNDKKNILITNDDGVEDLDRLICLAESLSPYANQLVIVASAQNRSGTSNTIEIIKKGKIEAKQLDIPASENISVYEVAGYPGDCVLFGTLGVFGQRNLKVDLVISGINGGANEGASWFGSGTIGAARTAAIMGIPAIAVSGIDEDQYNSSNRDKICDWVADFSSSTLIENMDPFEYLTISIPDDLDHPPFLMEATHDKAQPVGEMQTWLIKPNDPAKAYKMPADNDVFHYYQGYIVIVPMSINENRPERILNYKPFESDISPF